MDENLAIDPVSSTSPAADSTEGRQLTQAQAGTQSSVALRISKKRLALALVIAAISDVIAIFIVALPPLVWALDFVTALLLFMVLGWRWLLLPGLILEAIPGVAVFPF